MRLWLAAALVVCACASAAGGDGSGGFVSLFNGKNLDGWVVAGNPEGFTVVDGRLHSEGGRGGQWIHTTERYGNFVLRMEWMLSQVGNSGVFIRTGEGGGGFEVQLLAPWTPPRDDLHCTGSIYGHVAANPRPDETPLRWRQLQVTAAYKRITVKMDGVTCAEADYDQVPSMKDLALDGYVGMQDSHTGPGEWVEFRKIEIRDLDQDPGFLCDGLAGDDSAVRRTAYDAAIRLGPPMVLPLLDLLKRGGAPARHAAEMALTRIVANASAPGDDEAARAAREALVAGLTEEGGNAAPSRACAARLLGLIGQDDWRTVAALRRALAEGGPVSEAALGAMQVIPGRPLTASLMLALRRADESLQPGLALALGARKDEAAIPMLSRMAREGSQNVRLAAVQALGAIGGARVLPVLREVGAGAPDQVRHVAVDALLSILKSGELNRDQRIAVVRLAHELAVTDREKAAVDAAR